jgi:HEAT repeat protein
MGFFEKIFAYFANRTERRHTSMAEAAKNPKSLKEDRQGAIEYFAEMSDCAIAVPALLQRFEFSLEHGINDTREKEKSMEGIIKHGSAALPYIAEHLKSTSRIAWPIKMLLKITDEASVIQALKDCLDFGEVAFDQDKTDKNYDILCYLADYKLPGYYDKIAHFLTVQDERVRYAAVELLCAQDDPEVAQLLEKYLSDDSNENTRLRRAVATAFLTRNWQILDLETYSKKPVPGLKLSDKKTLLPA